MDIQASIHDFMQQQNVVSLCGEADRDHHIKAGVVPFIREGSLRYCLMKPVAKRPGLGAPLFQLCKGTRMVHGAQGWQDMRGGETGEKEALICTALREGIEELGLQLEGIRGLYDVGSYDFASAHSGKGKQMWLFAAEMASTDWLLPLADIAATTSERGWLTNAEFAIVGREDHRYILNDIETKLTAHFGA